MKKYKKLTVGSVIQTFEENENGKMVCTEQSFFAGDQVDYEDMDGKYIDISALEAYQPFDMVQPDKPESFVIENTSKLRTFVLEDSSCGGEITRYVTSDSIEEVMKSELEQFGIKVVEEK